VLVIAAAASVFRSFFDFSILNAGSSSVKFTLCGVESGHLATGLLCNSEIEGVGHEAHFIAKGGGSICGLPIMAIPR
jgi:hypothetical protein